MRTLVPAESLVYLETNDLAAVLQPIMDRNAYLEAAKSKPDLSALKGVELAVVVTGFESSEEKLTGEYSVGRVQPRFVAVADTHAWNYQAVRFAEFTLGSFVANIYDSEPTIEKAEKNGGKFFTWRAKDGRKAYALVIDSLIFFGNDETAIDKCMAVRRGDLDSILKTGKVQATAQGALASGFVSTDGIAQIANIVGLKFASESDEDSEVQSAIAGIMPQLIRGSITDISWFATNTEKGIEDRYSFSTPADLGPVLAETLAPSGQRDDSLFEFLPGNAQVITIYNLRKPNVAWRSLLLTSQTRIDPLAGKIIGEVSSALLEPYGIRDSELFLSGVDNNIATIQIDYEGNLRAVIATLLISENVRRSLVADLKPDKPQSEEFGIEMWKSEDGDVAAAFVGNKILAGDTDAVVACLRARSADNNIGKSPAITQLFMPNASAVTLGTDSDVALAIANVLQERRTEDAKGSTVYLTETRFTKAGIERRTVSDVGLVGSIIAQLAQD